ncbi:unnamed protein product [Prorocentrum cordatum]|uniref:Uncharacterized protein n=1 Tax=Prorocentrum cordatum TaxID=2364126 RepID=A0ABN9W6R5_9DINO|nr:unnamed protein product [Polarella glacialis]
MDALLPPPSSSFSSRGAPSAPGARRSHAAASAGRARRAPRARRGAAAGASAGPLQRGVPPGHAHLHEAVLGRHGTVADIPEEHQHGDAWWNLWMLSKDQEALSDEDTTERVMNLLYASTLDQYTGCSVFGGRYWDIKLTVPYNCCATSPSQARGGFCMPHRCSRWQVANEAVLHWWRTMIASQYPSHARCAGR